MGSYFTERDEKNLAKLDTVLADLPEFVGQFIIGISSRTSVLTRLNYALDIRVFLNYLVKYKYQGKTMDAITLKDIEELKAFDIERYLDSLSNYRSNGKKYACGDRAKERKLASLRSMYKYLYKKDMIETNVTLKIDMPKIHDKPIIRMETNEVKKLIDLVENGEMLSDKERAALQETRPRDIAILYLFLGTGIRVSELVGLDRKDIDFDNDSFTVTRKGGNKSILYLPKESKDALLAYLADHDRQMREDTSYAASIKDPDALFYSRFGTRIGVRSVEKLVKKYAHYAAPLKKITPHKLRSTYATNLYRATEDIYVVADVLGHSDVNTTKKHYAQLSEENKRKAARVTTIYEDNDQNGDKN